jgi:folate-dependent phosphoribosylglycinamide formyltransferase PurN
MTGPSYALLLDSTALSAWQAAAIRELHGSTGARPGLAVVSLEPWMPRHNWRHLAFRLAWRFLVRSTGSHPLASIPGCEEVEVISCRPERRKRHREALPADILERLRALQPDFIVRFGFGILSGEILRIPEHGVWSYHHGDNRAYRGRPAAFWEMYDGRPWVGGMLQRLTEELDGGTVLDRWTVPIHPWSYDENLRRVQMAGRWALRNAAIRVVRRGDARSDGLDEPPGGAEALPPLRRAPTNLQMAAFLIRTSRARVSAVARRWWFEEDWRVQAHTVSSFPELRLGPADSVARDRPGRFLADPCLLHPDRHEPLLLMERFSHAKERGWIVSGRLRRSGGSVELPSVDDIRPALEASTHRSYPQMVLSDTGRDGARLLTVEAKQAGEGVQLLEVTHDGMVPVGHVSVGLRLSDPNIVRWEGRWWLLATDEEGHLRAWWDESDSLEGPWTAHALNPVEIDARWARGGGVVFAHGGALWRAAQDVSPVYGSAIWIVRVDQLSPTAFRQTPVCRIGPEDVAADSRGTHTLAWRPGQSWAVLDSRQWRFSPARPLRRILRRLRRRMG